MPKFFFALTLLALAGCRDMMPNWGSPGTADLQRNRAERFDPYPAEFGGNKTDGVRPRDYDKPALNPEPPAPWPWSQGVVVQ
ncbi:MAG TPA: hypothetical protein VJL29_06185 [Thermoguttaceae bacterium]|nr:hypothetical protein [Thermoguttaceae bacterium]